MERAKAIEYLEDCRSQAIHDGVVTIGRWRTDVLDMAIAALREQEQSKWISIKERLPEYNELVLVVWVKHDRIRRRGFGTLQREGVWYVSNEGMPPVTHWMPCRSRRKKVLRNENAERRN